MMRWDFRHITDTRARQIQNSVKLSTYEDQYHFPRRRVYISPLLCIAIILLCLWGLCRLMWN